MKRSRNISETAFKARVMRDLRTLHPIYLLKTQEVSHRGVPDILACVRGMFLALELKRDGEQPDSLQHKTLEDIGHAGGLAMWTAPHRWQQDFKLIKEWAR